MNRKSFEVTDPKGGAEDRYWKDRSYSERLEALEQLRRIVFGYDPSATRLQRTITITELKED